MVSRVLSRVVAVATAVVIAAGGVTAANVTPSIAAPEAAEAATQPASFTADVGQGVRLVYDGGTTFTIEGTGQLNKDTFQDVWRNKAEDIVNESEDNKAPEDFLLRFTSGVQLPDDSSKLFGGVFPVDTRIEFPSDLDTSNVTDMSGLFEGASNADPDVSGWDVSNVTDMSTMFKYAKAATPDVSRWDTSNVTDMSGLFEGASNADPDVSGWNVSNVTDMSFMFSEAQTATPDVSHWDTSNVTNMSWMFNDAFLANPDVSHWDTSNVVNAMYMFFGALQASPNVSSWKTPQLVYPQGMFSSINAKTLDVSRWDTSKFVFVAYDLAVGFAQDLDIDSFERFVFEARTPLADKDSSSSGLVSLADLPEPPYSHLTRWGEVSVPLVVNKIVDKDAYYKNRSQGIKTIARFTGDHIPDEVYADLEDGAVYELTFDRSSTMSFTKHVTPTEGESAPNTAGFEFHVSGLDESIVTGHNGQTQAVRLPLFTEKKTVTVTETQKAGYSLASVECSATPLGSDKTSRIPAEMGTQPGTFTLTISPGTTVHCDVTNRQVSESHQNAGESAGASVKATADKEAAAEAAANTQGTSQGTDQGATEGSSQGGVNANAAASASASKDAVADTKDAGSDTAATDGGGTGTPLPRTGANGGLLLAGLGCLLATAGTVAIIIGRRRQHS